MFKKARERYNASFSTEKYEEMLAEIEQEFPNSLEFRIAETPVFIDRYLKTKLLLASNDVIDTIAKPNFKKNTEAAIPSKFKFKNESEYPHFLAIDFAICLTEDGVPTPQLIEAQGFPSLFAYQSYVAGKYKKHFDIIDETSAYFNRLNNFSFNRKMEQFLKGNNNENTILLEVHPESQKTRLDFVLSEQFWQIPTVCLTELIIEDKEVFYLKGDEKIKVDHIYNRVIFDDVERNYPELLNTIEKLKSVKTHWLSHPNWFYRVSKYMLPLVKSPFVPESHYLSEIDTKEIDLSKYVLKPLFSFAGQGVKINLTQVDLDKIENKEHYLLQEKVKYEPIIEDINGEKIKAEVRMLFIWEEGKAKPQLMTNLCRLSRGEMIGVDHNKDFDWVGGSAGFFETN